jgi:hypothetical protein
LEPASLQAIQAWIITFLLYPGLLLGVALALCGEWLLAAIRPLLVARLYRSQAHPHHFMQPAYDFLKLAGRSSSVIWHWGSDSTRTPYALAVVGMVAPVAALSLLPLPGNPIMAQLGVTGDLFTVFALLTVQPLLRAFVRIRTEGQPGALDLGRFFTGLVPVLAVVAALIEVSHSHSLGVLAFTAAPETGAQTLVRLLAATVLLLALPWWLDWAHIGPSENEGLYAGRLLQTSALSAFWSLMVLPALGDLPWAVILTIGGALFAYVAMRAVALRWAPAAREKDAASLLWRTALPVAVLALVVALWPGV